MTEIVAVLLTTLILGYPWHRDHLKLTRELDVARSRVHPSRRHLRSVDR